jgi:LysM repeat protein
MVEKSKKASSLHLKITCMKKIFFTLLLLVAAIFLVSAQKGDLIVKSSEKGLYLEHKVIAKESFYSVGRLYNVSPKFIASYNKLDLNKGLNIDQKIRIPLTDTNFTQKGNNGTPVYYKVGNEEGLMSVSKKNKDVLLTDLRSWNNLSSDELKKDTKLIIGLFLSKEMRSGTIGSKPMKEDTHNKVEKTTVVEPVLTKEEKKAEEKEAKAEYKAEKKDEEREEKNVPIVITETQKPLISGEGYFKNHFESQVKANPVSKNETVTSGIFKTISGWQDAKYYLLIDKVPPGTIVKVINPVNNKAVYAKVLGEMSGIRQNEGLNIRVSNAAASVLEIAEADKFIVKVNY